jgi:mannose-6-phosphate isomerase-like protein (cupin superfamily)
MLHHEETVMRPAARFALAVLFAAVSSSAVAQPASRPTPNTATDISHDSFMTVLRSMNPDGVSDQQIKVVDIGSYNVAVGILHRSGKARQTAIAHSEITEIYYVVAGSGTFVTGGTMTQETQVAPDGSVVKVLVGPSTTGAAISGGQSRRIGPGDVIIVPPGVAHWFSAIEQDLDYLVFRVDPKHVLPAGYVHPLLKR